MSKLYRSLLWSGLVVAGVAACGDDVTVAPPPNAGVQSVTVGPTGVTIAVGQTLQMAAAVNADAGIATTVTWSSSNAATASVNPTTGLVTGVASGSVAITACSTVATGVCGQATVTVAAVAPATISIKSITNFATNVPVNINNVVGQIDVTLNLDAGSQQVSSVEVLIDGVVACSQGFSLIQAATARAQAALIASDNPTADLAVEIVCSINTADFNATTGVAKYFNGPRAVTARVNLVGSAPKATPSTTLIFNNSNTFAGSMTVTAPNTSATSPNNALLYRRGGLSFSVLPVIYVQGVSLASGSVTFGGCDNTGARTATLTAPAAGSFAWTATMSNTATASGSNVTAYEYDATLFGCSGTALANGEGFVVNGVDGLGNTALAAAGPALPIPGIRLDNVGPGAPTFIANPNGRQNGWINAAVGLVGLNTGATDNDWMVNGAADVGVGGYTRMLRTDATAPGTVAAANASAASAAPATPARSLNNNDYCNVASATDALGNESALPANATVCLAPPVGSNVATGSTHLRSGVDLDAPTIAFSGGLAALGNTAGRILAATVGTEFQVTVLDAGAIGVSGMLAGSPVIGTVKIFNAGGTTCLVGTTSACVAAGTGASFTPALPLVATNTVAASVVDGYFTGSFLAQDAAGNQSATITRSIVHEVAGNPGVVTNALFNVPLSGSQATFQALASDNLDLRDIQYNLTYGGGLAAPILYPVQNINPTPPVPATLMNSNISVGTTINGFMRQIENVTGNAPVTVGGQFKPNNLQAIIRDQVQTSAAVNTGILAGQVTTGTSYLTAAATQLIRSWAITNAATNVSDNAGPGAAVNPLSVTLVADAFGPTATFNAPFTRVDFYALFGGFLVQIGTGTADITNDDGSPFGRRQRWTFTWTPGTSVGLGAISLFAIGVNANGDALVSPVNTNITVTNP